MSLELNLKNVFTRLATEFKALRTLIGGSGTATISGLSTTDKTSLVAAINEVKAVADAAGGTGQLLAANNLSDVTNAAAALANLGGVTQAAVDAQITAIVGAAPAALDTLTELATALGNDSDFAGTVTSALANRVRADVVQGLTVGQQLQARENIGAVSVLSVGDTEYDLVAHFEAALA